MKPTEVIHVPHETESVGCDGGGGALGHPTVYYAFGERDEIICEYCSRKFVRDPAAAGAH